MTATGWQADEQTRQSLRQRFAYARRVLDEAQKPAIMLNGVGISSDVVVGYADDKLHMWNRIKIGSKWLYYDITWCDACDDTWDYAYCEVWYDHKIDHNAYRGA